MSLSENIVIDDDREIITAFGQKMSSEFLRAFSEPTPPGVWFRIITRQDGALTICTNREDVKPDGVMAH